MNPQEHKKCAMLSSFAAAQLLWWRSFSLFSGLVVAFVITAISLSIRTITPQKKEREGQEQAASSTNALFHICLCSSL